MAWNKGSLQDIIVKASICLKDVEAHICQMSDILHIS